MSLVIRDVYAQNDEPLGTCETLADAAEVVVPIVEEALRKGEMRVLAIVDPAPGQGILASVHVNIFRSS